MTDLDALYAQVPLTVCRGLCWESCFSVGLSEEEAIRIEGRHGVRITSGVYEHGCPALSPFHRCSVYADRPLVCRLWGAVTPMVCPHGCVPEGGMMDEADALGLLRRLVAFPESDAWRSKVEYRVPWPYGGRRVGVEAEAGYEGVGGVDRGGGGAPFTASG